jgi:hypothetical protein
VPMDDLMTTALQTVQIDWPAGKLLVFHLPKHVVLALTKNVLDKACVSTLDDVDEVYPCTPIQEALVCRWTT